MTSSPPDPNGKWDTSTDSPTNCHSEPRSKGVELDYILKPSSLSPTTIGLGGSSTYLIKSDRLSDDALDFDRILDNRYIRPLLKCTTAAYLHKCGLISEEKKKRILRTSHCSRRRKLPLQTK